MRKRISIIAVRFSCHCAKNWSPDPSNGLSASESGLHSTLPSAGPPLQAGTPITRDVTRHGIPGQIITDTLSLGISVSIPACGACFWQSWLFESFELQIMLLLRQRFDYFDFLNYYDSIILKNQFWFQFCIVIWIIWRLLFQLFENGLFVSAWIWHYFNLNYLGINNHLTILNVLWLFDIFSIIWSSFLDFIFLIIFGAFFIIWPLFLIIILILYEIHYFLKLWQLFLLPFSILDCQFKPLGILKGAHFVLGYVIAGNVGHWNLQLQQHCQQTVTCFLWFIVPL